MLKPYHNVLFELLKDLDKNNFSTFANLTINHILYSNIENNFKKKIVHHKEREIDFSLNVDENNPYLPKINSRFNYTLVLDLDETLIHFFYVSNFSV